MKPQLYKSTGSKSLFDEQFTVLHLSEIGNPLGMISQVIDFEKYIKNQFLELTLNIPNDASSFSIKFREYIGVLNEKERGKFLNIQLYQEEDLDLLFGLTLPISKSTKPNK